GRRGRLGFAAEAAVGLGGQVGKHGVGGYVLRQRGRVDLVQGVVGGVVQVEVVAAVLRQPRPGAALGGQRAHVRAGAALVGGVLDAEWLEHFGNLAGGIARALRVRRAGVEGVD